MEMKLVDNLVSVIIPVYNSERFISEAITSALNQTYMNIEIILVDDCSPDNSARIIEKFTQSDSRVHYYKLDKNSGAAYARNTAMKYASGRYVAFLDSDDIWYAEKVENQINLMNKKKAAICYTAIEMVDENGKQTKPKRNIVEEVDYKYILKNTIIACSSVIVDRKILGSFEMPLIRAGQDYATWLMLMRNGTKAYGINQVYVKYRQVNGSISHDKKKAIKKVWNIYRNHENLNYFIAAYCTLMFSINALIKYSIK